MPEIDTGKHPITGQQFLMSYVPRSGNKEDWRTHKIKTMLRPKSYKDAVFAALSSFPEILIDRNIIFESKDFPWDKYARIIEPDEWERPEIRSHLWEVLVTELVDPTDDFAVTNPNEPIEVYIINYFDIRPNHAVRKGHHVQAKTGFFRSTTILQIKIGIGQVYGVQPSTFSLMRYPPSTRFGLSSNYLGTYTDNVCIGEICPGRKVDLAIVWTTDRF